MWMSPSFMWGDPPNLPKYFLGRGDEAAFAVNPSTCHVDLWCGQCKINKVSVRK